MPTWAAFLVLMTAWLLGWIKITKRLACSKTVDAANEFLIFLYIQQSRSSIGPFR